MKKTTTMNQEIGTGKVQQKEDRQKLQQLLLKLTEDKIDQRFSDARLDREHEKIQLLNGSWTSLYDVRQLIAKTIAPTVQPYEVTFPQEFYRQIYRLTGRPIPEGGIAEKPHIIAQYTNEIIYLRFTREVLEVLRQKNPLGPAWMRLYKHHQWLTKDGKTMLLGFIQDAIHDMKACTTNWHDFQFAYAKKYILPIQTRMPL